MVDWQCRTRANPVVENLQLDPALVVAKKISTVIDRDSPFTFRPDVYSPRSLSLDLAVRNTAPGVPAAQFLQARLRQSPRLVVHLMQRHVYELQHRHQHEDDGAVHDPCCDGRGEVLQTKENSMLCNRRKWARAASQRAIHAACVLSFRILLLLQSKIHKEEKIKSDECNWSNCWATRRKTRADHDRAVARGPARSA